MPEAANDRSANEGAAGHPVMAWGGRFAEAPDARLAAFNASIGFDVRFVREDIRGSIGHVRMLGQQQIITADEAASIERGLWQILAETAAGTLTPTLTVADEDIHTAVERHLREVIGPVAGKLHTGRSRNDQTATDLRLWTKGAILAVAASVSQLSQALLDVATAQADVVMPGYTHLQRAQPVLLAHHLHAYVAMLSRDFERLQGAYRRTDVLPLGSAALAGTTYPIDRRAVATDLGFSRISANSLDAVSDRDFVVDVLAACAQIAIHLSRLSEEIILWASGEFRFIELADAFATGSSIMPQKKNPDVAELARGKSGRVIGHLVGTLTMLKGLPLAYDKDMQEDKEALFDTIETTLATLDVFPPMLRTATFNRERMAAAAEADFSLATDVADVLARHGVPFREAHEIVGRLVARCIAEGITFADLTPADWTEVHAVFGEELPPRTATESVAARDVPGGTAPRRVMAALEASQATIRAERAWLEPLAEAHARLWSPPATTES